MVGWRKWMDGCLSEWVWWVSKWKEGRQARALASSCGAQTFSKQRWPGSRLQPLASPWQPVSLKSLQFPWPGPLPHHRILGNPFSWAGLPSSGSSLAARSSVPFAVPLAWSFRNVSCPQACNLPWTQCLGQLRGSCRSLASPQTASRRIHPSEPGTGSTRRNLPQFLLRRWPDVSGLLRFLVLTPNSLCYEAITVRVRCPRSYFAVYAFFRTASET